MRDDAFFSFLIGYFEFLLKGVVMKSSELFVILLHSYFSTSAFVFPLSFMPSSLLLTTFICACLFARLTA